MPEGLTPQKGNAMRFIRSSLTKCVQQVRSTSRAVRLKYAVACAAVGTALLVSPAASLATETESETKVKEVATQVSSEGVTIILAILAALVALIALVIILPKAVKMIKRFV